MTKIAKGARGYRLEELLRAYFLRAGFFAVRGVPFQVDGDDLTDIDVWLYERPTGSARRRQIVDAKSKSKPKAIERLLWTKGLSELLEVDGAYIATTDSRPVLREISNRLGVSILDGSDIKRISESDLVLFPDRISEESILDLITKTDKSRRNKDVLNHYKKLKFCLIDNFGAGTANRAIEIFTVFSILATSSHPNSETAAISIRLAYFAASIAAIALDFVLANVSLKSAKERHRTVLSVIRYGDSNEARGLERVRLATALIEEYAPNGRATAQTLNQAVRRDYESIPAEIIADYVLSNLKSDGLFKMACVLEHAAYMETLHSYDQLEPNLKSFLGVLLDFVGIERAAFASSWTGALQTNFETKGQDRRSQSAGPLFDSNKSKAK